MCVSLHLCVCTDVRNNCTDTSVSFTVTLSEVHSRSHAHLHTHSVLWACFSSLGLSPVCFSQENMAAAEKVGLEKKFKLTGSIPMSNMVTFFVFVGTIVCFVSLSLS